MQLLSMKVLHHVFKVLAYGLCAFGCLYQVGAILKIYFSFPSLVFSFVEIMDTLQLPALTICNNNRIMLSKLRALDDKFEKKWTRLEEHLKRDPNRTKLMMQRLLDRTVRRLMDSVPVNEFALLGHEWSDLLPPDWFKCATDPFNLNNKCIKYANLVESVQASGNCFTVFGRSDNDFLGNIAIKSGLWQSPVIRGTGDALNLEIAEQPFHPNEIFRVLVNLSWQEYTTTNERVSGFVVVHDPAELPAIRDRSMQVYPGVYYELYVNKQTDKYLAKPYATDCVQYGWTEHNTTHTAGTLTPVLSRHNCLTNCMADRTVTTCHCWPPELPFVLDRNATGQTNMSLRWCSWRDGVNVRVDNKSDINSNWFRHCFANHETSCDQQCKLQCQVDKYNTEYQSYAWPSKERMEHSTKFNHEYRECCAIVSLRYWSSEQETLKYEPKYTFAEFISYFGGLLSVWIGFSLVRTYDFFEAIMNRTFKYCRSNKKIPWKLFKKTPRKQREFRPREAGYFKTRCNKTSI